MPRFQHFDLTVDMPDEWWCTAGMTGFIPVSPSYTVGPSEHDNLGDRPVLMVAIADVMPLHERHLQHGMFRDRENVMDILSGFKDRSPIPPVLLVRVRPETGFTHRLFNGAHRFYCSLAVGFTHVPAIEVAAVLPNTRKPFDAEPRSETYANVRSVRQPVGVGQHSK